MYTIRQIAERSGATKQRVRKLIREQGIRMTKVRSDNKELKKAGFKTGMIVVTDAEAERLIALLKKNAAPGSVEKAPEEADAAPGSVEKAPEETDIAPGSVEKALEETDAAPGSVEKALEETDPVPGSVEEAPEETDPAPGSVEEALEETDPVPGSGEETPDEPDAATVAEESKDEPDPAPASGKAAEEPDDARVSEGESREEKDGIFVSEEKKEPHSLHLLQADELSDPLSALIREKNERIRQLQEDLELERQRAEEERHRYDVLMTVINRQSLDIQRMIALGVSGTELEEPDPAGGMAAEENTGQAEEKPLPQEDTARSDSDKEPVPEGKGRSGPGKVLHVITRRREKQTSTNVTALTERNQEEEICEDCNPADMAEETASAEENPVQKYDDGGIQLELKAVAGKKENLGGMVVPLYPELINDSLPELEEPQKKSLLRRFLEVFGIMDA